MPRSDRHSRDEPESDHGHCPGGMAGREKLNDDLLRGSLAWPLALASDREVRLGSEQLCASLVREHELETAMGDDLPVWEPSYPSPSHRLRPRRPCWHRLCTSVRRTTPREGPKSSHGGRFRHLRSPPKTKQACDKLEPRLSDTGQPSKTDDLTFKQTFKSSVLEVLHKTRACGHSVRSTANSLCLTRTLFALQSVSHVVCGEVCAPQVASATGRAPSLGGCLAEPPPQCNFTAAS